MMLYIVGCITFIAVAVGTTHAASRRVCERKGEYITCPFGEVIHIEKVEYGRQQLGICNPYQVPNLVTNCQSTSISTNSILQLCEYKSTCFLDADNTILGEDPCPNIPKYLTVDFLCVVPTTTAGMTTPLTTKPTTTTPTTITTRTTTTITTPTTTQTTSSTSSTTPTTTPSTTRTTQNPTTTQSMKPFSPFNAPKGSQTCHDYLVSGPNGVEDSQLSASSVFGQLPDNHGADRGRLFTDAIRYSNGTHQGGAWSARYNDQMQYIQVQFNSVSIVRGVATQGRHVNPNDLCCYEYVSKYRLMYSLDCVNYNTVKDINGNDKIFVGNSDQDSVVSHMLDCAIMARCVRVNPLEWKDRVSLRFDLLGCPASTADLGKCPKGWEERPGSDQCYLITDVHDMRTRDDASAQCQLQQGQLVKIDSIAERDWIRQKVSYLRQSQGQHHFWTGLENRPRQDSLGHKWTDGTPLDTTVVPWGNGQPDNTGGNEHCGELWDGDMNDNDCDQHYPYICEKSKFWSPPANTPSQVKVTPATLPTTRTTAAPLTVTPYVRPVPVGANVVIKGNNVFITGCKNSAVDCSTLPAGDYQSCQGCHYYLTCAPSGVFIRPCPARLKWDDNLKACDMISSTCQGP